MSVQDWSTQPESTIPGLAEFQASHVSALWLSQETMTIPTAFVTRLLKAWDNMALIVELAASKHEPEEDEPPHVEGESDA